MRLALGAILAGGLLFPGAPAFATGALQVETGGQSCPPFNPESPELCGIISLPGGGHVHYYFELGASPSYSQKIPAEPGTEVSIPSNEPTVMVTAKLDGLQPNTTYHYRLTATDDEGYTRFGADATFTTPPITTPPIEPITPLQVVAPGSIPLQVVAAVGTPPGIVVPVIVVKTPTTLTKAQEVAKALRHCEKKPRLWRARCKKRILKKYNATTTKSKKS